MPTSLATTADPLSEVEGLVRFSRRPAFVGAEARTPWRMALLCVVLNQCRGKSASLEHLHLLNWSLRTSTTRGLLKIWLDGVRPMDSATTRLDPSLETTIRLGIAENLIDVRSSGKVALSDRGKAVADELENHPELFRVEREYLASLGPLSEAGLRRRLGPVPT